MAHGFLRPAVRGVRAVQDGGRRGDDLGGERVGDGRRRAAARGDRRQPAEFRRGVSCEREMAIICAVGEDLRDDPTLFGRAVSALDSDSAADGVAGGVAAEHHVRAARRRRAAGDDAAARRRSSVSCRGPAMTRVTCEFCSSVTARWAQLWSGDLRAGAVRRARSPGVDRPACRRAHGGGRGRPIGGAASTWRSISRRADAGADERRRRWRGAASTSSSARPDGRRDEAGGAAGGRRRRRRRRSSRRISRSASSCSRRSSAQAARLFAAQARVRRLPARSASRGEEGRAVGHGAAARSGRWSRPGFTRPIDVSSTRAGFIPGTHTVGFDGPAETITLTHSARDRTAFARGALDGGAVGHGRRGWFTMKDVLGLDRLTACSGCGMRVERGLHGRSRRHR